MKDSEVELCTCNAAFHRKHLGPWLAENNSCPLCKKSYTNKYRYLVVKNLADFDVNLKEQFRIEAEIDLKSVERKYRRTHGIKEPDSPVITIIKGIVVVIIVIGIVLSASAP